MQVNVLSDESASKRAERQILDYSKKIDFYTSEFTVEILADKVRSEEYTIPEYQREFIWEAVRKSRFIESLIIGLPIPFLFFWESERDGKLEIVDGSQRLRTLEEYLSGKLILEGLERLDALNGLGFNDLPMARQRKIKNKSIRGIVLSETTDTESRIDLFERINTGPKVANPTEVRRGVLQGDFMSFVNELAELPLFNKLAPVSVKQSRSREREELITRFFAYSDGLDDYKDDVSPFLFRYIKRMNLRFSNDPGLRAEYLGRIERVLSFVDEYFEVGFRKVSNATTTPRSRFEALSVGVYQALSESDLSNMSKSVAEGLCADEEFKKEVRSDGANAKRRLSSRIDYVSRWLLEKARS